MWVWQERKFKCVLIFEVTKKRKFASIKYMYNCRIPQGKKARCCSQKWCARYLSY
jgi:hypothetical protein